MRGSDGRTPGGGDAASKGLRRWGRRLGLCLVVELGLLAAACGFTEPPIDPITHETLAPIPIPPAKGQTAVIDIMVVDQATHRLWVADGTNPSQPGIDVFDLSSVPGRYIETIKLGAVPFGLVIAPDLHRLYSGNDDGSVAVIDIDPASPRVNRVVRITTGAKGIADLIEYDPKDHLVFVTNPDDGMISVIDPHANRVVGTIGNLNRIDQPRYDPADGMLYVGALDDNLIYKIDPVSRQVKERVAIPVTCEPHGIAISPRTNHGIIGCADRDQPAAIAWDFGADRMIRTFDQSGAGDAVIYDEKADQFFFAALNYSPPEMSIFSDTPEVAYLTSVPTSHKSHTVAYDEAHDLIIAVDGLRREAQLWYFPNPVAGRH